MGCKCFNRLATGWWMLQQIGHWFLKEMGGVSVLTDWPLVIRRNSTDRGCFNGWPLVLKGNGISGGCIITGSSLVYKTTVAISPNHTAGCDEYIRMQ